MSICLNINIYIQSLMAQCESVICETPLITFICSKYMSMLTINCVLLSVCVSGADVINFDGQGVIAYRFKVPCLSFPN